MNASLHSASPGKGSAAALVSPEAAALSAAPRQTGPQASFDIWGLEPNLDQPLGVLAEVQEILAPMLSDLGFSLVRLQLNGQKNPTLQIMAEPSDGSTMTVEHCGEISTEASALLDVEDPIQPAYTLEVSSPGLDRPLTRPRDFSLWQGYEARIEARVMIEGRKRFTGLLAGWYGDAVQLDCEEGVYQIALSDISRAKLLLTDRLVDEAMKDRLPQLAAAKAADQAHTQAHTQADADPATPTQAASDEQTPSSLTSISQGDAV